MSKQRKIGLGVLIALVTGNMVGSGAFLLPAELARIGSISLISLGITILGALALAVVFAEMSLLVPKSGGPYVYAQEAFGEYLAFQTAHYYWIGVWIGNAAIVVAALGYLDLFFPLLHDPWRKTIAILALIWAPTLINLLGVRLVGFFQILMAILKFVPLLLVGIGGWCFFHPEYLTAGFNLTGESHYLAISSAITITLWLFVGVESATVPGDLVERPEVNIPRATLLGTILAAVIYLLSNVAIFGMFPTAQLAQSTSPFALAAAMILGDWGKFLVAGGAFFACFGALSGWILVAAQIPLAAAREHYFPRQFAVCNRHGVPAYGLIATSICITSLILLSTYLDLIKQFELLILVATAAEVLSYFYTCIAQMILLPNALPKRRYFGKLTVALIAASYSGYAIWGAGKHVLVALFAMILLTLPLYAIFKNFRRKAGMGVAI